MKKILIIGATSAIAEAAARIWAKRGDDICLIGRDSDRLQTMSQDLKVRGAGNVLWQAVDLNQIGEHEQLLNLVYEKFDYFDVALIAHGTLSNQVECEKSVELALSEINTNGLSVISLLTHLANHFEKRGSGTIAAISSVAGDRGRQSNYVYGSAKALVTAFTSGLRQRLFKKGVAVVTIKPGFVDTPMTAEFKKGILWAKPDQVARTIVDACDHSNGEIYAPKFWQLIMFVIKAIPEFVFKKLKI